jgi:hypothetical protein
MPEPSGPNRRFIGRALLASAGILLVIAALGYSGVLPVPDETRGLLAVVTGLAALADVAVAMRFLK